jgi:hypothetical protein
MFTDQRRYGHNPSVVVRCSDATFYAPLRKREWREMPAGGLVFTCSWSDWFHEDAARGPYRWRRCARSCGRLRASIPRRDGTVA